MERWHVSFRVSKLLCFLFLLFCVTFLFLCLICCCRLQEGENIIWQSGSPWTLLQYKTTNRLFHVAAVMKRQHFNTSSSAFPFSAGASSFSASGSSFFSSGLALTTSFCFLALAGAAYHVKKQNKKHKQHWIFDQKHARKGITLHFKW